MGRSYNLKKSPINKGTAAKPSPMKAPLSALAIGLLSSAAGAAVSGGIGAASSAAANKKAEKAQKEEAARQSSQDATASIGNKKIGTSSKIA